jgi:PKD repeat protein
LSNATVAENQPIGTAVGNFSTTDPDALNTFTYTLAVGAGDTNNASFAIVGNQLQTGASFNFEAQASYSVRVRTTDQDGLWFENSFTIAITNVNEAPTAVFTPSRTSGRAALLVQFNAAASFDIDAGSGDSIVEYAWDWNGDGTYDLLTASPLASYVFHQGGAFGVKLRVRDTGGLTHVSAPQVITVDPPSVTWVYTVATNTLTITGGTYSEAIVLSKDLSTGRIYIGGDIDDVTTAPAGAALRIVINSNGGSDTIDLSALTSAMYSTSTVNAGDGQDTVLGGGAADYINGGRGNDCLTGNGGADRFQFDNLDPTAVDAVMDFQDEIDKVDLSPYSPTLTYANLSIVQDGADTLITLPNGQKIRLKNFNRALLASNDFNFRPGPPVNRGQ